MKPEITDAVKHIQRKYLLYEKEIPETFSSPEETGKEVIVIMRIIEHYGPRIITLSGKTDFMHENQIDSTLFPELPIGYYIVRTSYDEGKNLVLTVIA